MRSRGVDAAAPLIVTVLLLTLCLAACAAIESSEAEVSAAQSGGDHALLVMLRTPTPHFRADRSYGANYTSGFGREGQRRNAEAIAAQYGLHLLDSWPMPALGVDCFVMQASDKAPLARVVEELAADPRVESAQSMNLFHVLAHNDPLYTLQPSATLWHLSDLHRVTTGKRVRVAEIDTGVETRHPDLAGQVALVRNLVDGQRDVAEAHGTAVAGIIAAKADNGIGIAGIAPNATLLALRACWETPGAGRQANCSSFTLAKALQLALDDDVQVINLSIGGPRDRLLERLLDVALARGIVVVAAADPSAGAFPASHRGVFAVAGNDAQDPALRLLVAPAQDIPTTLPGRRWGIVSGSSFAAAHVTGLVALLRELAPGLPPDQIREALAARGLSPVASDHAIMIDACAAVARTAGTCACGCTEESHAQLQVP